ncbi:MAG: hypothetical protein V4615_08950 [Bacteroidota bacterium]
MKSASTKFLITVFVVTVLCVVFQIVWNQQAPEKFRLANGFVLLGIFSLSITGIHLFLLHSAKGEGPAFIRKYLASAVLKFMFYIFLLVVFLLFSSDNKTALILHFLFYYAVFTVLEVSFLYLELGKLKK